MSTDVEAAIRKGLHWDALPTTIRHALGNSQDNWKTQVRSYCTRHQMRYENSIATSMFDREDYYSSMLHTLRENLLVYPYHLADVFVRTYRVTPFDYYLEMLSNVLKSGRSYDTIPNFTATDAYRLTGIGRNEAIHILNKFRSKGWLQKLRKNTIREQLPTAPQSIPIDYWWIVHHGYVSSEEMRRCNEHELSVLSRTQTVGVRAGELPMDAIRSLYSRKLIYLEIPIREDDHISLPPLQGFVMNRVLGDPFEKLLYQVFVSVDERNTVGELARTLETEASLVMNAISFYCRVGFAKKKNVEPLLLTTGIPWDESWLSLQTEENVDEIIQSATGGEGLTEQNGAKGKRIGLLFDSTLTAFLMMGNLSHGLKSHAVTMFEVGKLPDESMDSFLTELDDINEIDEGEAERYFDHAVGLRDTIRFLRHNDEIGSEESDGRVDLLRCESVNQLNSHVRLKVLNSNYAMLISLVPLNAETLKISCSQPTHFGPAIPEVSSGWFKLFLFSTAVAGPSTILIVGGTRLTKIPFILKEYESVQITKWGSIEPTVVSVLHFLPIVNEALLTSPVLVQGHIPLHRSDTREVCEMTGAEFRLETLNVSFPQPDEGERSEIENLSCVSTLVNELGLNTSCGYITLARYVLVHSDDEAPAENAEEGEGGGGERDHILYESDWHPVDLQFGIPLFDHALNLKICDGIKKHKLFEAGNVRRQSLAAKKLSLRLLHFIARLQGTDPVDTDLDETSFPTANICFYKGQLSLHPNPDTLY